MPLEVKKRQKRSYQIFHLIGELDTNASLEIKNDLEYTLNYYHLNICLNLMDLTSIDNSGVNLIINIQKMLQKTGRKCVLQGGSEEIIQLIQEKDTENSLRHYQNHFDFENSFLDDIKETRQKYLNMAEGTGLFKELSLICPICDAKNFSGHLLAKEDIKESWADEDITPQITDPQGNPLELSHDLYEISVCPRCYFASARLEHFGIQLGNSIAPCELKKEQIDRISKKSFQRNKILSENQKERIYSLFAEPMEPDAGWVAWQLYDRTLRGLPLDRGSIDCLEVSRTNILSAKFAPSDEERNMALTTAQVWLTEMMKQPDLYVASELAQGYVFLISVNLAMDKEREASILCDELLEKYKRTPQLKFWTDRGTYLMED